MDAIWEELYETALGIARKVEVSDTINCGSVGAAVMSSTGKIYTGICINVSSSLGMCAERNAISTMFTQQEYEISKVVSVYKDGKVWPPCGACREFMYQTNKNAGNIEIMVSKDKVITLSELLPEHSYM